MELPFFQINPSRQQPVPGRNQFEQSMKRITHLFVILLCLANYWTLKCACTFWYLLKETHFVHFALVFFCTFLQLCSTWPQINSFLFSLPDSALNLNQSCKLDWAKVRAIFTTAIIPTNGHQLSWSMNNLIKRRNTITTIIIIILSRQRKQPQQRMADGKCKPEEEWQNAMWQVVPTRMSAVVRRQVAYSTQQFTAAPHQWGQADK